MIETVSKLGGRRRLARLRTWRVVLTAVVAALAVGFCGWVVFFSPWLAAQNISVAGAKRLSAHDIEAAADVTSGTPLVRLNLDQIERRVAQLPAVSSVAVHRSWPHTVSITVTERQPVGVIRRSGQWWVLDAQGVVFRETGQRARGFPVIAAPRASGDDALREAASVVAALPPKLLAQTKRLTGTTMDSITLHMRNQSAVRWGNSTESQRKVEVLKALLVHVKAAMYDVSVPEQPTTSN